MSQFYFDPTRADDPHALPDGETFYYIPDDPNNDEGAEVLEEGWYYWACMPGCLPDGDPIGPFATEAAAIAEAQADYAEGT